MSVREELLAMIQRQAPGEGAGHGDATKMPDNWVFKDIDPDRAKHAAVLILFGRLDDVPAASQVPSVREDLDVLFVTRADTLRKHAGQVAFPGGKIDPEDTDAIAAAVREAEEETGLDPDGVEILGVLPDTELPVSNFIVTPVVGWWHAPSDVFAVDLAESSTVFRAPVADLLDPANRVTCGGRARRLPLQRPGLRRGGRIHLGLHGHRAGSDVQRPGLDGAVGQHPRGARRGHSGEGLLARRPGETAIWPGRRNPRRRR